MYLEERTDSRFSSSATTTSLILLRFGVHFFVWTLSSEREKSQTSPRDVSSSQVSW
jgi:hypothetical protein